MSSAEQTASTCSVAEMAEIGKVLLGLGQNAKHRKPQRNTGIPLEYHFVGYLSKTEHRKTWKTVKDDLLFPIEIYTDYTNGNLPL